MHILIIKNLNNVGRTCDAVWLSSLRRKKIGSCDEGAGSKLGECVSM